VASPTLEKQSKAKQSTGTGDWRGEEAARARRTSRVRLPPEREGLRLLLLHDGRRAARARADAERTDAAGQRVLVERLLGRGLRWWWPLQRLQEVVRLEEETCTHVESHGKNICWSTRTNNIIKYSREAKKKRN
jgi:hypothetical protein